MRGNHLGNDATSFGCSLTRLVPEHDDTGKTWVVFRKCACTGFVDPSTVEE